MASPDLTSLLSHPRHPPCRPRPTGRDRRPGLPAESPMTFHPRYLIETVRKQLHWASIYLRSYVILRRIIRDRRRFAYLDSAITDVAENETETRELFQSQAARDYVTKFHRIESLRKGAAT